MKDGSYCGIDFGYWPDPFVCQWWAKSPEGAFYRELYRTKTLVEDHARRILEFERQEVAALQAAAALQLFRSDSAYVNVHTSALQAGEIRGRIVLKASTGGYW